MSSLWEPQHCIASRCGRIAEVGDFCVDHAMAAPTKKAGWASAHRRRRAVSIDASSIALRLWVGAAPPVDRDIPSVDVIVLCAEEIQPRLTSFHGRVIHCPLPDALPPAFTNQHLNRAVLASGEVAKALAHDKKRVLVTCAMGRNRSALVAALALGRITRMSSTQLVTLVRHRRDPSCLSNDYFRAILHRLVGQGRRARAR